VKKWEQWNEVIKMSIARRKGGRRLSLVPCVCVFGILPCTLIPHSYIFSSLCILQLSYPLLLVHFSPAIHTLHIPEQRHLTPSQWKIYTVLPSCYVLSLVCENGVHHVKISWTLSHTYSKEHSIDVSHRSSVVYSNKLSSSLHLALKSLLQLHVGTVHKRSHSLLPSQSNSSIL